MTHEQLLAQFQQVNDQIAQSCRESGRNRDSVELIAVSKRHPAWKINELLNTGHRHFAENYLQEALGKIEEVNKTLGDFEIDSDQETTRSPIWHFIGHIQSRKCRDIAAHFDWVHTVESEKVAVKLNQHRQSDQPLNILIQLNLQHESSKSGIPPAKLAGLAEVISTLPNLSLRGLMIIPKPETDIQMQRAVFRQCRERLETLIKQGFAVDQLSMGMSADMGAAIIEGATQIRIGTAIFGPRPD